MTRVCTSALLMALVLVLSACTKAPAPTASSPSRGKTLFVADCSQCHGATGTEGGIGPSLHDERTRKGEAAAIAWIENPQPPMPKLFPGTLREKDVADVAAYVESL